MAETGKIYTEETEEEKTAEVECNAHWGSHLIETPVNKVT